MLRIELRTEGQETAFQPCRLPTAEHNCQLEAANYYHHAKHGWIWVKGWTILCYDGYEGRWDENKAVEDHFKSMETESEWLPCVSLSITSTREGAR